MIPINRLFVGGDSPIKMESIRIRRTLQNYEDFISALCYLDRMISGAHLEESKDEYVLLISDLMNNIIGKKTIRKYDSYIYDTFECFIINKRQMVLDLPELYKVKTNNKMIDLIMNGMERNRYWERKERGDNDATNLFVCEIFKVFKNIKNIIIITTTDNGLYCYTFSIVLLLWLIESTSVEKLIVKAVCYWNGNEYDSWLHLLWNKSSSFLKQQYQQKNYDITKKRIKNHDDEDEDWLEIIKY